MQEIGDLYSKKTVNNPMSMVSRESSQMFWIKSFNNWIKAVLINKYCQRRGADVRKSLDMPPSSTQRSLLHILDIGCGHGQDISKWSQNGVGYIVGIDVSEDALSEYLNRWRSKSNIYDFFKIMLSAADPGLYSLISHSYYDIVSAQLSLHYMFGSEATVRSMLSNVLENLLDGGFMVLTIPDSCAIIRKIRTVKNKQGDYYVYGNKYFSIRFKSHQFDKDDGSFGLEYGFYLREAIGSRNEETGETEYWNQYLIELTAFENLLKEYDMDVVESWNFLEFYEYNKAEYCGLFSKMKLIFGPGQSIHEDFWEIAHLYRIFVARKKTGKGVYSFNQRMEDRKKRCQPKPRDFGDNHSNRFNHSGSRNHRDNRDNSYHNRNNNSNREGHSYERGSSQQNRGQHAYRNDRGFNARSKHN